MSELNENVQNEDNSVEALRLKYSRKNTAKNNGKRFSVPDILLLIAVIAVSLTTVIWFATPVVELGGEVYKDGTRNIFSFLFASDGSMLRQITSGIDSIKNIGSDAEDGIGSVMGIVRAFFLFGCGCITLVYILICLIFSLVYFFKGRSEKLISVSIKSVINKLEVYVVFVFFGSMSGGNGLDAYYIGYSVGTGMTVGVLLSIAILVAVAFFKYFKRGEKKIDKTELLKYVSAGAVYTAIAITVTFMRLYSVFVYALTSLTTAVAGLAVNGFGFKAVLFPLLNVLLFAACRAIVAKTATGFKICFEYILNLGVPESKNEKLKYAKKVKKARLKNLIFIAATSFCSCFAVLTLSVPTIGFGWSVNFYPCLIAIFALSSTGLVFNAIVLKKAKINAPLPENES